MNQCKYTFLLPAYKATYFEETLFSIKNQFYKDFKVLVSDDCSPENLESIFQRAVGDDARFTFRRNAENMGSKSLVSHWNLLVDLCDTKYLILASDDDVYDKQFLEEVDRLIQKYPEVDLIRGRVQRSDGTRILDVDTIRDEFESQLTFLLNTYRKKQIQCIANYVFKTKSLKENGGFVALPLAWGSDEATIVSLTKNGVAITKSVLFSFRWSGRNISTNYSSNILKKKIEARKQQYDYYCKCFLGIEKNLLKNDLYLLEEVKKIYKENTLGSIYYDLYILNLREVLELRKYLISSHFFCSFSDSLRFIWFWIKVKFLCLK